VIGSLTPAQHRVALLRAAGLRKAEIARRLGLSPNTVSDVTTLINHRLGTRTPRELAVALQTCAIECLYQGRASQRGFVRGGPVRITGGAYAGREGHYVRSINTLQVCVRVGAADVALQVAHLSVQL